MPNQTSPRIQPNRIIRQFTILLAVSLLLFTTSLSAEDLIHLGIANVNYREGLIEVARRYEQLHPDIDIKLSFVTLNYETWVRAQFAGGLRMAPDVFHLNFLPGYEDAGRVVELSEFFRSENPYTGKPWMETLDMDLHESFASWGNFYSLFIDRSETGIILNHDIFERYDLSYPESWEEMLDICKVLKEQGVIPFAVSADMDSFWLGHVGWLVMMLGDAYLRDDMPLVMARPGDWNYIPEVHEGFVPDFSDPYSDLKMTVNEERRIQAILDGKIDFESEDFRAIYTQLKRFSQYWPPGCMGLDSQGAYSMFLQGKAAMMLCGSSIVSSMMKEMSNLPEKERFEWQTIQIPPIKNDPRVVGPFRSIGGPSMTLAITQKHDPEHHHRVVDFLMFLTTPENIQILVDEAIEHDKVITGPFAVKGVELPSEIEKRFEPFYDQGYRKGLEYRGLHDEQESVYEWSVLTQEYLAGRLTLDEYLEQHQELIMRAIPRIIKKFNYDLDPTTKDSMDEAVSQEKNPWDPLQNGSLLILILVVVMLTLMIVALLSARNQLVKKTARMGYLLILPTMLLLTCFSYYPAISGLLHAFTEWEEGRYAIFNGLDNFRKMASDYYLFRGAGNLLIILTVNILKSTLVPLAVAEMIIGLRSSRLRSIFRVSFLLPIVTPAMVMVLIWRFIYNPNLGVLNQFLDAIGLDSLKSAWLGEPALALPSILFIGFPWVGAIGLLIYLAGLNNIPPSVYDSAQLECRTVWQRIRYIDVPLVSGQTKLLVILTMIMQLQDFALIMILTNGGPGLSTMIPALRMYHVAFRFSHYGYGAAIGFVLFFAILIVTILNNKFWKVETY